MFPVDVCGTDHWMAVLTGVPDIRIIDVN